MLRVARAALFAAVPAELVVMVLLVSGVSLPGPLLTAVEVAVLAVVVLEGATAWRLYRAERRGGAGRKAACRGAYERLVPVRVRRVVGFDTKGMVSLVLWVARRRHGVPQGARAFSYSRAQTSTLLLFLFAMVVELVGIEVLLRETGVPAWIRTVVLVIDAYSVVAVLAILASCVTRPHVVTGGELRVRYGAFFDLRVPRERVAAVHRVRRYSESGTVKVEGEEMAVAVASQTNVRIELAEPMTATRPLGRRVGIRSLRFFADEPEALLAALAEPASGADTSEAVPAARGHQGWTAAPTVQP
ncbi:hypothetical protein [Streptomyces sp. NPDC048172]|uniref:hypothetical protein n=1 Tax=Streptomyces sp. NPDC048172 TaxID=3365505 RepID=UPI003716E2FA